MQLNQSNDVVCTDSSLNAHVHLAATACYEQLNSLLTWMTGAPAGLKLNEPFSYVLGEFFRYHLYLWRTFILAVRELILMVRHRCLSYADESSTVHAVLPFAVVGILGFSGCIGLFIDFLSICLVHINCFYVYATRLYSLQLSVAKSLLRLFVGKKYNPLRGGRIDSVEADADQMFVGTILMTILIFLLPTSAVFYFVFVSMRLMQLSIIGWLEVIANWYMLCGQNMLDISATLGENDATAKKFADKPEFLRRLRTLCVYRVRLIQIVLEHGGLFSFTRALLTGEML